MSRSASYSPAGLPAGPRRRYGRAVRVAIAAVVLLAGCLLEGDGERVTVARRVPAFDSIEVFGDFTVEIAVRPALGTLETVALEIEGESNVMERLFTEVHGDGVLSIAVDPNLRTELTLAPKVTFAVPALREVFAADRSAVTITGGRLDDAIAITATEASTVAMAMAYRLTVEVAASGTSRVTLAGTGPLVVFDAADSAEIDASGFYSEIARVTVADATAAVTVCTTGAAPQTAGETEKIEVRCAE
jgi:hypothetical protein